MRLLVVEDEVRLCDMIKARLEKEKYTVDITYDGEEGLYMIESNIYDLVILDVMLPGMNGFEILKKAKEENINSKVILLTAKSQIDDKLKGFNLGVDDYITKPFHLEELVARVNVQLRKEEVISNKLVYNDLELNLDNSSIKCLCNNEEIEIVFKELSILEYLINNQNQIVSKELIYDKVWGLENDSISNNLEAYMSFIRRKLKTIGSKVNIKSVRNLGYKLEYNNEEIK